MKCGLLGRKLGHSYSPQIHAYLGDYSYELFEKEPEQIGDFLQNGDFTDEEVEDAKQNLLLSLKIGKNKKQSILSNFEFSLYTGAMSIEDKIENIKNITKKDIVKLAKKIKENTVYILSEEKDERNNN